MNRRRWLIGASGLAGALFAEWRAHGQTVALSAARTMEYWTSVADILGREHYFASTHVFDQSNSERGAAQLSKIEQLPQVGVDPELLGLIPKLAKFHKTLGEATQAAKWYHGYFWPTPPALLAARKEAAALKADLAALRKAMARRYGRPFPEIPFPKW